MSQVIISSKTDKSQESENSRDSRSRRWMMVLPARLPGDAEQVQGGVRRWSDEEVKEALDGYSGWVGQVELGLEKTEKNPEGYLHWQLYLEHEEPIRFSTLQRKFGQLDLQEARKPRAACVAYCTKEETRVSGPFWFGDIRLEDFAGKRNDLEDLRNQILLEGVSAEELIYSSPRAWRYTRYLEHLEQIHLKRSVGRKFRQMSSEYYWGKTGTGKTRGVYDRFGYESVYRVVEYGAGAFDAYAGEPVVLLDEYRSQFPVSRFLALLEGHPLRTGARYSDRWAQWEKVIVVSNESLQCLYRDSEKNSTIPLATRQAIERRFECVRQYTSEGEFIEEFSGLRK